MTAGQLPILEAANVSTVPNLSPFRYPGGKTWLVPVIRQWLAARGGEAKRLIEPFAGGGIVSLTAATERLVDHATLVEIDSDVAVVWKTMLNGKADKLANHITSFRFTKREVKRALADASTDTVIHAFQTI